MVFSDRKFIVIRGHDAIPTKYDALEMLITAHGGEIVHWDERTDLSVSPKLIVISKSMDYDRAEEMKRLMVPTVVDAWVHACIKEGKLVPMRPYSPDPRNFMRDVMACFSNLSTGDTDVFKAGLRASGGDFTEQVTRYTSHVVATGLDTDECQLVLQSRENNPDLLIKLVRPEWIDDCMKLCCKVDDTPYQLDRTAKHDDDLLLQQSASTQDLTGTFPVTDTPRLAVQQSVRESLGSNILEGRRVFLSEDLGLSDKVEKTVRFLIETNGGSVETNLLNAQVYLGKWREGEQYLQVSKQKGVIIGNITWLYWIMIHQKFELPTRHLLHYPEVKGGMPSMRGLVIGVSNYTGDARAYLQSLIQSLGAKYTGKLAERHTTHLITAYESGAKFSAAKKWGIPVVNHLWLEETYANWSRQDESQRRFTYFPKKIAMSTLIGNKQLIPSVLMKFAKPEELRTEREPRPKRHAKQKADDWLHDAMIVESEYLKKLRDRHGKLPPLDAGIEEEEDRKRRSFARDPSEHALPVTNPHSRVERPQSRTPSSEPEAKNRHVSPESESAKKRRLSSSPSSVSSPSPSSKQHEQPEQHEQHEPHEQHEQYERHEQEENPKQRQIQTPKQKQKHGENQNHASKEISLTRVMFSGVEDLPSTKECHKIGISIVKTYPARILVAPRMLKTPKFLQCLADAEAFVTPAWVSASLSIGSLVPVDDYRLQDPQLIETLDNRAKLDGRGLFEGKAFKLQAALKDRLTVARGLVRAHKGQLANRGGTSEDPNFFSIGDGKNDVSFDSFISAIYRMDIGELHRS